MTSESDCELRAAAALRRIALNEDVKAYILQNSSLYRVLLRAALRFIGGETLPQCIEVARALNARGFATTIDYMGESTRTAAMAEHATREFSTVIRTIAAQKLNSSVSLDLSHIGMAIDADLAYDNASFLAQEARDTSIEIMISMEGMDRTTTILAIHQRLCERFENVGLTLQAYLYRTPDDLAEVLKRPGKIRLVKGAYEAPTHLARSRGEILDTAYRGFVETVLRTGHALSIATHDPLLLDHAHGFAQARNLQRDHIEFEMLKGITPARLQTMHDLGYRTRVYLPYGQEWYLYLCNRLAEYPANIYHAIADAVGGEGAGSKLAKKI